MGIRFSVIGATDSCKSSCEYGKQICFFFFFLQEHQVLLTDEPSLQIYEMRAKRKKSNRQ